MTDVNKLPTSDYSSNWRTTGSYRYTEIDDPVGSPDDLSSYIMTWSNGVALSDYFGFSAFSIPSGSTSISVKVTMRIYASVALGDCAQQIRVGGTEYRTSNTTAPSSFTNYTYTWSTNPKRSAAWTVDDINGVGSYALQYFGIYGQGYSYYDYKYGWSYYDVYCTQCYLTVSYTPGDRPYAVACGVGTVVGSKSTSIG